MRTLMAPLRSLGFLLALAGGLPGQSAFVALAGPAGDQALLEAVRPDLASPDPEQAARGRERLARDLAALAAEVRGPGVVALQTDVLLGARAPGSIELAGLVGRPTLDRWLELRDPFHPGSTTEVVLANWSRMPRRFAPGPGLGGAVVAYLWIELRVALPPDPARPGRRRLRGLIRAAALADQPGGRVVAVLEPAAPALHPETRAVLARLATLPGPVELTVLQGDPAPGRDDEPARLLEEDDLDRVRLLVDDLAAASPRLRDRGTEPGELAGLRVEGAGRKVVLRLSELFEEAAPGSRERRFRGERELAALLRDLLDSRRRAVYFVEGHGEARLGEEGPEGLSLLGREVEAADYSVAAFDLGGPAALPEDAAALVLAGPRTELPAPELARLEAWLRARRPLLVMLEPDGKFEGLGGLLRSRGVGSAPNLLIEPDAAHSLGGQPFSARPDLNRHSITNLSLGLGHGVTLRQAMGLETFLPAAGAYDVRTLLQSSGTAWGETRIDGPRVEVLEGPDDLPPPLSMAVAVSSRAASNDGLGLAGEEELRLVVVGDSDWVSNRWLGAEPGHRELFLETLRWVLRREVTSAVPSERMVDP